MSVISNLHDMESLPEDQLEKLVIRLESVASKFESNSKTAEKIIEENLTSMSTFWEVTIKNLSLFILISKKLNNSKIFFELIDTLVRAFCLQQDLLKFSHTFQRPSDKNFNRLISNLEKYFEKLDQIEIANPDLVIYIECIRRALSVFNWLFSDNLCEQIAKFNYESLNFPITIILLKKSEKYDIEKEWTSTLKNLMKENVEFVDTFYKKGLLWSNNNKGNKDLSELFLEIGGNYRSAFQTERQIKEEQAIKRMKYNESMSKIHDAIVSGKIKSQLKPVETRDNAKPNENDFFGNEINVDIKNNLNNLNNAFIPGVKKILISGEQNGKIEKSNDIILYENFSDLNETLDEKTELKICTCLRISNCLNCNFTIKNKISSILIINCENCNVSCKDLLSDVELINNTKVKFFCEGLINMFNIEGCKNITLLLSKESRHAPVYTHQSTEVMLRIIKENSPDNFEYINYTLPEQKVYKLNDDNQLEVKVM